ncbi:hypothetical protein N836_26410 [Leptolyngbya sp. Heron Island J]|uniref:hypothetical protein n=1 Tax=Leptolyngbya sp. Heron Island J TaxID=1385935 RepID=UPI0003B95D22|nr:hypothetical protein [Leptolyngbya sp. Heron Island J]ESA32142.1 hypothetical protein N836_26410 [Leptolyngbya sp. Heron Island J]
MPVLSLKTELDVAELLLTNGWFPEEINGVLVFPLPRAAFHQIDNHNHPITGSDVIKATVATPTTLYRARQLLESAGWLDRELDSLLKPCVYTLDPWAGQTIRPVSIAGPVNTNCSHSTKTLRLRRYRWTMALRRILSLAFVILLVLMTVFFLP